MTELEKAAVAFIAARRAKNEAKRARGAATNRGHPWVEPDPPEDGTRYAPPEPDPPCWKAYDGPGRDDYDGSLPESEWCPHCLESKRQHEEYLRQARRTGSLLRRLERLALAATPAPSPEATAGS